MAKLFRHLDLDQIVTLGLGLIGVAVAIGGVRLRIGTVSVPEPGFFPFISGTLVACLSLCRAIGVSLRKGPLTALDDGTAKPGKAVALAAALVIYTLVLEYLGYILATTFLAIVVMRITHRQSWVVAIGLSVLVALLSYYLFSVLLQVSLPARAFW